MKKWPDKNKPIRFSDAIKHVRRLVGQGYDLVRKNRDQDLIYEGYNIGWRELTGCLEPPERFKAEYLRYSEEEQGRDLMDEILGLAFQLGIEQGRRMQRDKDTTLLAMIDIGMETAQKGLAALKEINDDDDITDNQKESPSGDEDQEQG